MILKNRTWGISSGVSTALAATCAVLMGLSQGAWAGGEVSVTLMHTNDLHSHFRGDNTPLGLGGVARLKTAIQKIRASVPHTLLVDGGDWSEGNIYYNEGAGRETLRMMDHLGYDVAVLGNHDWLNGAEVLMGAIDAANPAMSLIATNVSTGDYTREADFRRRIPPYVIKELGGVKIAFIGLVTYEFIYDAYLKPVKVTEPFALTRELAHRLKKQVDAVIVISHNTMKLNQAVLKAAPEVDFVVGAHDHVKLIEPLVVERPGAKPGFIVETGCWGRYLGQVDLRITPRDPTREDSRGVVELVRSRLIQMDRTVPENPETLSRVASLEAQIEAKRGPIFHDHLAESEVELSRDGMENLMGNLATDAYLSASQADFAIDQTNFIYNEIHSGPVRTVDVFNSNPGVYDPRTDKAWTLHTIPLSGNTLSWVLNLLFSSGKFSQGGSINLSGAEIVFSPPFASAPSRLIGLAPPGHSQPSLLPTELEAEFGNPYLKIKPPGQVSALTGDENTQGLAIKSFKIRGAEIESGRIYQVAIPGGVVSALRFLDSVVPGVLPLSKMRDTGQEDWRVIADHLQAHSPVTLEKIPYGNRLHTVQADLGILYDDVGWEPRARDAQNRMVARVHVRVRNTGTRASLAGADASGPRLALLLNENGVNYAIPGKFREVGLVQPLPSIAPGESIELAWDHVVIPETLGVFALTAQLYGTELELNHSNDEVTRWFTAEAR